MFFSSVTNLVRQWRRGSGAACKKPKIAGQTGGGGENFNKTAEEEWRMIMGRYVCNVCGYVYDPEVGDSDAGIEPGVPFEKLPEDWVCPVCGAGKDEFAPE
jgi:rubredoxin